MDPWSHHAYPNQQTDTSVAAIRERARSLTANPKVTEDPDNGLYANGVLAWSQSHDASCHTDRDSLLAEIDRLTRERDRYHAAWASARGRARKWADDASLLRGVRNVMRGQRDNAITQRDRARTALTEAAAFLQERVGDNE